MKALVGTFNQEKALVGAFSVIVKTDGSFAALLPMLNCWRTFPGRTAVMVNEIIADAHKNKKAAAILLRAGVLLCCRRWSAGAIHYPAPLPLLAR